MEEACGVLAWIFSLKPFCHGSLCARTDFRSAFPPLLADAVLIFWQ